MRICHTRTTALLGIVGITAAALSACSSPTPGQGIARPSSHNAPAPPPAGAQQGGGSSSSSASPVVRTIGKTTWYAGFAITVNTATITPDSSDAKLTLAVTYKNLTVKTATPSEAGYLQVNSTVVQPDYEVVQIAGLAHSDGTISADVTQPAGSDSTPPTPDALLDTIVLTFGQAGDNQSTVPLAAGAAATGEEPKTLTLGQAFSQGPILGSLVSGTVAPSYESGEKGKDLISVRVKLTCPPATCAAGGYNVDRDQFTVTGADGNPVVADTRSNYCCDAMYPGTVSDHDTNVLIFVVSSPATGSYKFEFKTDRISSAPKDATFTIS